jgi:hypothetical protein
LIPTVDSTKRGVERKEGSGKGERNFRCYPDGKRNKKISETVSFRNDAMGFNDCPDAKRSEIRIACAICKMSRDVSTIVLRKKGMKANKVIIISHSFILMIALMQKRLIYQPQISNDNIVHPVSTVNE